MNTDDHSLSLVVDFSTEPPRNAGVAGLFPTIEEQKFVSLSFFLIQCAIFNLSPNVGLWIHTAQELTDTRPIRLIISLPLDPDTRNEETAILKQIIAINHLSIDSDLMIRGISARIFLAENNLPPLLTILRNVVNEFTLARKLQMRF